MFKWRWFISAKNRFGRSETAFYPVLLPRTAALPSAPCHMAAISSIAQLWVLPRTWSVLRKKIARDYVTKDRLTMYMHKRAKLRSCRKFCNDSWLLNFSSAPTLLPSKGLIPPPPSLHYFVSSASSFLPIPSYLQNHVSVSISCPYFDTFCTYGSYSPISHCCSNKQFTA